MVAGRKVLKLTVLAVVEGWEALKETVVSFGRLFLAVREFQGSLYYQKHAFYFRKVKQWMTCLSVSATVNLIACGTRADQHIQRADGVEFSVGNEVTMVIKRLMMVSCPRFVNSSRCG